MKLTAGQRPALRIVATLSFIGTIAVFLYYLIFRTGELFAVLTHPVALVFVIDVFTLMVLLAAHLPAVRWAGIAGRHSWL